MYKGCFAQANLKRENPSQPLKHHKVTPSPKVTQRKRIPRDFRITKRTELHKPTSKEKIQAKLEIPKSVPSQNIIDL
ncbi:hypothetical protein BBW65_01430 [Helicobacter enhydrae]|uniref:Uncharacterized protein n=1 Tax=Helicobacter enhydrae TaxID=222136 RepID=A0A1B1U469_9HELI|nr:hypothetical protein BBW65_01430 [Helicobacter enhydrae]